MDVTVGYKHTDVGIIPVDWKTELLSESVWYQEGPGVRNYQFTASGVKLFNGTNIENGKLNLEKTSRFISTREAYGPYAHFLANAGDIVIACSGISVSRFDEKVAVITTEDLPLCMNTSTMRLKVKSPDLNADYFRYFLRSKAFKNQIGGTATGSAQLNFGPEHVRAVIIPIPPTKAEQEAIAEALSDADAYIESLEQLLAKKRDVKQGAMQELLTGKRRLPGFDVQVRIKTTELGSIPEDWSVVSVSEITNCLDNVRVPLNDSQRSRMRGDFPYCGANGVLDYINSYCLDESVILMAEDGGYFDEYRTRPIAYRMSGKIWVNNHAHILKSKSGFSQDFIFYSLVHKDILRFIASGTRAKLNRSELNKIPIALPSSEAERISIATLLSDMDSELLALEAKLVKARDVKQGMMQELLTGKIRLV